MNDPYRSPDTLHAPRLRWTWQFTQGPVGGEHWTVAAYVALAALGGLAYCALGYVWAGVDGWFGSTARMAHVDAVAWLLVPVFGLRRLPDGGR